MKSLLIILLLCFNIFAATTVSNSQKPKIMLESISKYSIRIGNGDSKIVYLFVDPLCKFSKAIVTKISKNKMLQLTNSYYILLYRLPRLDSKKLIQYILQSNDPKSTLFDVMVDGDLVDLSGFKANVNTEIAIENIAEIAKKLDIKIRPYMISFEKDSKYCSVSEGTASCLEELAAFEE